MDGAAQRLKDPEPRIHPTAELKGSRLGRYVSIGERVILRDVAVGDFSYFERHAEAIYTTIGKFCSIAANTRVNALEHPMERVTTHKVTYRPNEYFQFLGVDQDFKSRRKAKTVSIGHDVWIGHGAVILPGVTIGSGAVIGANAVVRHDVPAYAIVAGVPGRVMRRRFDDETCKRLETLGWWDWPLDRLAVAIPDMQRLTVGNFLARWSA